MVQENGWICVWTQVATYIHTYWHFWNKWHKPFTTNVNTQWHPYNTRILRTNNCRCFTCLSSNFALSLFSVLMKIRHDKKFHSDSLIPKSRSKSGCEKDVWAELSKMETFRKELCWEIAVGWSHLREATCRVSGMSIEMQRCMLKIILMLKFFDLQFFNYVWEQCT